MKLWWGRAESNLERHARQHAELLERAKRIAEAAAEQRDHLVARANGHLVEFQAEIRGANLGSSKDAGKS